MAEPQEIKTAFVVVADKAIKQDKNNKDFWELTLTKDNRDVKMRCFEENKDGFAQCKAAIKFNTYEVSFTETQGKSKDGKPITYRNIVSIGAPSNITTGNVTTGNVTTSNVVGKGAPPAPKPEPRREEFPDVKQFRNSIEMTRRDALEFAVHWWKGEPVTEDDILKTAHIFADYLMTGETPELPQSGSGDLPF